MIKTKINKKLQALLEEDKLATLNIKGVIQNNNPDVFTNKEHNAIWIKNGYFHYVYGKSQSFISEVLNELTDYAAIGFSGTDKEVRDYLYHNEIIHWENPCKLLIHENPTFTKKDLIQEIDSLTLDDAEFVNDNYEYKNDHSLDKMKDAIINRPTSCVRINSDIVSYALLHEDNSIGYMFTVKEHRKKGYAYEVTKDITLKTIETGRLPYIHIASWNDKSLQLATKAGYKIVGEVFWFGIFNTKGKDLQKDYENYQKHYTYPPTHLTTALTLSKHFEPLQVDVTDKKTHVLATYEETTYKINYIYKDYMYFLGRIENIPNEILRSILINFPSKEEKVYVLHLSENVNDLGLHKI